MKSYQFTEIRVRTKRSPEDITNMKGKVIGYDDRDPFGLKDIDLMLGPGPVSVRNAAGQLLCLYLPGALDDEVAASTLPTLREISNQESDNRGAASGGKRIKHFENQLRSRTPPVKSAIVGAFDAAPPKNYCRLTAWSGREAEKFSGLFPLFQEIGDAFAQYVPDRYATQMSYISRTKPDWKIAGTPFTTITVNRSYPTGVHTDAGDLEEGFSNLAVFRRGDYIGGYFTFAEYRFAVDMKQGDLLLMDAHAYHGNTYMVCNVCGNPIGTKLYFPSHDECGVERVSVVCYYRTNMAECGTPEEEFAKARAWNEARIAKGEPALDPATTPDDELVRAFTIEQMAEEAMGQGG